MHIYTGEPVFVLVNTDTVKIMAALPTALVKLDTMVCKSGQLLIYKHYPGDISWNLRNI